MKKVLILCDLFPPAFGPRMGYLVKYLKMYGWQAVVVTEQVPEETFAFMANECEVTYVDYYKNTQSQSKRMFLFLFDFFFGRKNQLVYQAAMRQMKNHTFDVVLCSSYRSFPLGAAQRIAQKTGLPLIVDLRDIIEQYTKYEFLSQPIPPVPLVKDWIARILKNKMLKERNRALKKAKHVTTVSPWHVETLARYNKNTSLIYNGYDPELFYPAPTNNDRFTITYTGRLLSLGMRNPDLLFRAVSRLSAEGFFSPSDCRLLWYIDKDSEEILRKEAEKYSISSYMDFKGYIPASEIPQVLNAASILLLLTNSVEDGKGPRGVMTTKFFESLAVERPVLCVRSDEGCLADVIKETNIGLAAKTEEEVYSFLKKHYLQWKETGQTSVEVTRKKIAAFSRKEQAAQFARKLKVEN